MKSLIKKKMGHLCFKGFDNRHLRDLHIYTCYGNNEKIETVSKPKMSEDSSEKGIEQCSIEEYICDGCDIVFYEPDKLLLHYLEHHDLKDEEITFDCANCYKSFQEHSLFKTQPKRLQM